jgi:hypothetical protein
MESTEVSVGKRVRVCEPVLRPEWWGMTGTVKGTWGHPEHLALDVLLDNGRSQLFWHFDLEPSDSDV